MKETNALDAATQFFVQERAERIQRLEQMIKNANEQIDQYRNEIEQRAGIRLDLPDLPEKREPRR